LDAQKVVERWVGGAGAQESVVASLEASAGRELRLRAFGDEPSAKAANSRERVTLARCENVPASQPEAESE
jgi:hypothetical protein